MIQEVVAIVDRSGSMSGKEEDTIGGCLLYTSPSPRDRG